jgi:signal transduction histidine kinase/CheY-like chemotaxis protein
MTNAADAGPERRAPGHVEGDRPDAKGVGRSASPAPSLESWVRHERVSRLTEEIPAVAMVTVLAVIFVAWVLRSRVPLDWLFPWLAAQIVIAGGRVLLVLRFRVDPERFDRARDWALRFAVMQILAGLLWSLVPIWAGRVDDVGAKVLATAIVVAVPMFAVVSQRYFALGAVGLVLSFLAPYVVFLLAFSTAVYRFELAVGAAVYAATVILISRRVEAASAALLKAEYQRERLVEEFQRAKDLADSANRAKSDFLANVSHELRTPLTVVLGMAQLLKLTVLDAEQREGVGMIERSGESLLALINQILDLSKAESGRLELETTEFDVRETVEAVQAQLAREASSKGLEFRVRFEESLPQRVRGDEVRLRQVLRNLCDNAIKFTSSGYVEVLVARSEESLPPGQIALRFSVTDTGIGMDKVALAGAFEPFFQADSSATRRFGGTGLGLAISRRLVRLMGGTISVKSELGRGSKFTFTAVFERIRDQPAAPERTPPEKVRARALLVEDDPVNAMVSSSMLKNIVEWIDTVDSGERALRAVQEQKYDVILMDCLMPGMDGYEAARRIRDLERGIGDGRRSYIIALTASGMPDDRERCMAAGMDAFVHKPYKLEELRRAVIQGVPTDAARTMP